MTPFQGWKISGGQVTQGVALGYGVDAPLARKRLRTNGAQPASPGQRPGNPVDEAPAPSTHKKTPWKRIPRRFEAFVRKR